MCRTELEALEEQVRQKQIDMLVDRGLIKPIISFDEYNDAIQKAKREAQHRLFTNSYMMRAEVERLIKLNLLYQISIGNGIGFVENQKSYWRLHLYIDLEKRLRIPRLDKSILIEAVYLEDKITESQKKFRDILYKEDIIHFYETYRHFVYYNIISKKQYDAYYRTIQKTLEKEKSYICVPNDEQLYQFERLYREYIDIYTQSFYTFEERKQQRDKGLIGVLVDMTGKVLAISLSYTIGGGAIAVRSDCSANIYATAFFINSLKDKYKDEAELKKHAAEPQGYGWISSRNTASIRLHEMFGLKWTGKAFDQFIIPGYTC